MNVCVRCRKRFTPQNYNEADGWVCAPCMVDALKAELAELKRQNQGVVNLLKDILDDACPSQQRSDLFVVDAYYIEAARKLPQISRTRDNVSP